MASGHGCYINGLSFSSAAIRVTFSLDLALVTSACAFETGRVAVEKIFESFGFVFII